VFSVAFMFDQAVSTCRLLPGRYISWECSRGCKTSQFRRFFQWFQIKKGGSEQFRPSILLGFGDYDSRDAYLLSFRFSELSQPI
jgi:hypothetical protein